MNVSILPTIDEVLDYVEESAKKFDYKLRVINKQIFNGITYYSCIDDNYIYSFHQWIPEDIGKTVFCIAQFLNEYDEEDANGWIHSYEYDLCNDLESKFTFYEYIPKNSKDDEMWD